MIRTRVALVDVTFRWSVDNGECEPCGLPAAFFGIDQYGEGRHQRLCCVCAANLAADGWLIAHIDGEVTA